jgi:hypothetical protein
MLWRWPSNCSIYRVCGFNTLSFLYGMRIGETSQRCPCAIASGMQHAWSPMPISLRHFSPGTTSEPDFQRPRCWCCTDSVVGIGHLAGKDFMALQRDSSQCLPPPDACLCHRRYPFGSQSEVAARHHAASAEDYSTSRPANGECTLQKFPLSPSMTSLRESTKHCKPGVPWLGGDAVSHRSCRRPQLRSDRASR